MKINQEQCQKELKEEGLIPKKFYGQVFTTDQQVIKKLILAIKEVYKPGTTIIEIGSGLGYITDELIKNFDQVKCVEFDEDLFRVMNKKFDQYNNLAYIKEKSDVKNKFFIHKAYSEEVDFKINKNEIGKKIDQEWSIWLSNKDILDIIPPEGDYLLVGNIPFHISGKLYRKFMSEEKNKPYGMVFITDLQYAKTLAGQPPRCYRISLQAQGYGDIEILEEIPPSCVYPEPKVMCCLMRIMKNKTKLPKNFWKVVNYHWEHFPTPEVESPKAMGLKKWIELCNKK